MMQKRVVSVENVEYPMENSFISFNLHRSWRDSNMTSQNNGKECLYFEVSKEYESKPYFHREVRVWSTEKKENDNGLIEGLGYDATLKLQYQRGSGDPIEGDQTNQDRIIHQQNTYYSEQVEDVAHADSETFTKIAKVFAKMENAENKIHGEGLRIEQEDDRFKLRVFLLQKIGARQVERTEDIYVRRIV